MFCLLSYTLAFRILPVYATESDNLFLNYCLISTKTESKLLKTFRLETFIIIYGYIYFFYKIINLLNYYVNLIILIH